MSNEAPHWVEDTLKWSPERPFAPASPRTTPGPWSPAPDTAAAIPRPRLALWRIVIGVVQGLGFYLLLQARGAGFWPGTDPFLFDAIALPLFFAPLLVLDGIGFVAARWLAPFTAVAALLLAMLGWYHRWRIAGMEQSHAGLSLLALCAMALFIAQSFLLARVKSGNWRIAYADLFAASWTLAARLLVVLLAVGLGILFINAPMASRLYLEESGILALPLLGLLAALAFQLTAAWPRFTTAMTQALIASMTVALPLACVAALLLISATLQQQSRPLILLLAAMLALSIAINASYRGGPSVAAPRRVWRDACEVFGAFLLLILAGMAAFALNLRVTAFGWTTARLFAGVMTGAFLAYGLGYSVAALLGLTGLAWMRGLERLNIVLGLVLLALCLALASPLADPMRLAVSAQAARLERGDIAVEAFDFANLGRDGGRFGLEALEAMAHSPYGDIANAAALTRAPLTTAPSPNPTEIGANIAVRTLGARLPATLLARDWRGVAGVPACLTAATQSCDAFFMDLDGDGGDEILLVSGGETRWWGAVMKVDAAGRWFLAGRIAAPACGPTLSELRAGRFSLAPPLPGFKDMDIGGMRLSVVPEALGCSRQP